MNKLRETIHRLLPRSVDDFFRRIFFHLRTSSSAARKGVDSLTPEWEERIEDALSCKDNDDIPRHPDAGLIQGKWITMHNGVVVSAMGYYGAYMMNLLIRNKGVHEPQEEKAFELVIPHLPTDGTMLELGAYWAFYSLTFKKGSRERKCFMVEPEQRNILCGKANFTKNGYTGDFTRAYVGGEPAMSPDGIPIIAVDDFCRHKQIDHLDILHADIQGFELEMLEGARDMLSRKAISYAFISTHSDELHEQCIENLQQHDYLIVCDACMKNTYSVDGLIVAKLADAPGPDHIDIAKKAH